LPKTPASTSAQLIQGVQERLPDAWVRFNRVYGPLVYSWCREFGLQEHDAADVVQEVFRAVLLHVRDFRKDRKGASFRAWIRTITKNKVRDSVRRREFRPIAKGGSEVLSELQKLAVEPPQDSDCDDATNESADLIGSLLTLIQDGFDERTWQAFNKATLEGLTAAEVAEELGMSKGAVRQAKYRILQRLRALLKELG